MNGEKGMGYPVFTLSGDDGPEQDKRIIPILKEFGLKAAFSLNSSLFEEQTEIGRIGNIELWEIPPWRFHTNSFHLFEYAPHLCIPKDELPQVYERFEIASHTAAQHDAVSGKARNREGKLRRPGRTGGSVWKEDSGHGLSLWFWCEEILRKRGILYARSVRKAKDFRFPENPSQTLVNCRHFQKDALIWWSSLQDS